MKIRLQPVHQIKGGFKYNQLKISQTMQKATNINKLYNYWTDFERIYLSKIYEILSCRKNIHLKPTCI